MERSADERAFKEVSATQAKAVAEVSQAHAEREEAQSNLTNERERLSALQDSHDRLEMEMLAASEAATNEHARLSAKLEVDRKSFGAAELKLKQAHSVALAEHTERVRLLQLGYDRLDEDFLSASANAQHAVEEAARLKTKLAASLRQTTEVERSVAKEQSVRARAEAGVAAVQQSLTELEARSRLMEERGVVALLEKAKECAKVEEQLRILHKRNDRLEDEVLEAQVAVERKGMEAAQSQSRTNGRRLSCRGYTQG